MTRLLLFLCLLLPGCAMPTVIPTGNPITDIVVNVALEEAMRPVITGEAGNLLSSLSPEPKCRRVRDMVFCGDWR